MCMQTNQSSCCRIGTSGSVINTINKQLLITVDVIEKSFYKIKTYLVKELQDNLNAIVMNDRIDTVELKSNQSDARLEYLEWKSRYLSSISSLLQLSTEYRKFSHYFHFQCKFQLQERMRKCNEKAEVDKASHGFYTFEYSCEFLKCLRVVHLVEISNIRLEHIFQELIHFLELQRELFEAVSLEVKEQSRKKYPKPFNIACGSIPTKDSPLSLKTVAFHAVILSVIILIVTLALLIAFYKSN